MSFLHRGTVGSRGNPGRGNLPWAVAKQQIVLYAAWRNPQVKTNSSNVVHTCRHVLCPPQANMEPLVLTVDMAGLPQAWVALEEAITYHAKQMVAWSLGREVREFRGGWQRNGERSRIATKSILAIKGTGAGAHMHAPGLTNPMLFARDRQLCAYCGKANWHGDKCPMNTIATLERQLAAERKASKLNDESAAKWYDSAMAENSIRRKTEAERDAAIASVAAEKARGDDAQRRAEMLGTELDLLRTTSRHEVRDLRNELESARQAASGENALRLEADKWLRIEKDRSNAIATNLAAEKQRAEKAEKALATHRLREATYFCL